MRKRILTKRVYFFAGLWVFFFMISWAIASETVISDDILIVYSGDMQANIEPAGCCYLLGGIARTAAVIDGLKKEYSQVLVLDAGDFIWNWKWSPNWNQTMELSHPLEIDAMYRAVKMMPYDALNIADGEILSGNSFLNTFGSDTELPLTSLNVRLPETGPVQPKPYIIKQFDTIRIAIVGLTHPDLVIEKADAGFQFADPVTALGQVIREIRNQADVIILLSHIGWDNMHSLLEQVSDIDIVISGHDTYPTFEPEKKGKTLIVKTSRGGGLIGTIRLMRDQKTGKIITMTSDLILVEGKINPLPEFSRIESEFKIKKADIRRAASKKLKEKQQKKSESQFQEAEALFQKSPEEFLKFLQK